MRCLGLLWGLCCASLASVANAWPVHALPTYRALEVLPEVAGAAPVTVEPLEVFLRAEEKTIEALLASQEAWANANLPKYAVRPAALAFIATPSRSDEVRKQAFLSALRLAPTTKFSLFVQTDLHVPTPEGASLAASTLGMAGETNGDAQYTALRVGDAVSPLAITASATQEPEMGMDMNLWEDSPGPWGKTYGFGKQPYTRDRGPEASQCGIHSGFFFEDSLVYTALPSLKRSLAPLRAYQFSSLASLAFRTQHDYWGWRFMGIALYYTQNLTQPFDTSLAPGESVWKLLSANALAYAGMSGMKNGLESLLTQRRWALRKYQRDWLAQAPGKLPGGVDKVLANTATDGQYPAWNALYLRDVVARQSSELASRASAVLVQNLPARIVSDPQFDASSLPPDWDLREELGRRESSQHSGIAAVDGLLVELMTNFAAHSRNAVRGILQSSNQ